MGTEFGVNVDPDVLKLFSATEPPEPRWRRVPLRVVTANEASHYRANYTRMMSARGFKILGVLDRTAFPWGWDRQSVIDAVHHYNATYHLDAIQIGNEPDLTSDSSWTMPPGEWEELVWHACHAVNILPRPDMIKVGGGLASGDSLYIDLLDLSPLDAIAIHPYGRAPQGYSGPGAPFGSLALLYADYTNNLGQKPVWVTEFGARSDEIGRRWQARYLRRMVYDLKLLNVPVAIQFCSDDAMVTGYGLYDMGDRKPAALAYRRAIREVSG